MIPIRNIKALDPAVLASISIGGEQVGEAVPAEELLGSPLQSPSPTPCDDSVQLKRTSPSLPPSFTSIVLITSLLDKPQNIAGLCRTCEVFSIDTLVLGSKSLLTDKDFASVSMGSEKWVKDIYGCPPDQLVAYLTKLKAEGYTLIALEQCSTSIALQEYRFPSRVALLLGNERWGVRPDLLPLMHACLEIPQYGQIKSLNVHVAGSMLLWEIRRQNLEGR